MRFLSRLCVTGSLLAVFALAGEVSATARDEVPYTRRQVYSAALRYLRIDMRYEVTERDKEAAYLLFEYQPLGQSRRRFGAVEIVALESGVRLVVKLPEQPSYEESVLRDGLVRKLREDYGDTAPARPTAPAETPHDGEKKPDKAAGGPKSDETTEP